MHTGTDSNLETQPPSTAVFQASQAATTAPTQPTIRRGRGTFKGAMRSEEIEKQTQSLTLPAGPRIDDSSSVFTTATNTMVLRQGVQNPEFARPLTEEDEMAAQFAHLKGGKAIPLDKPSGIIAATPLGVNARPSGEAVHGHDGEGRGQRGQFGKFDDTEHDTARQLLFRGEKRRRYCMIVGDLQSVSRQVTLKLFGHSGPKPFKLQSKMIRLVNLWIGKPRRSALYAQQEDGSDYEEGQGEEEEDSFQHHYGHDREAADSAGDASTTRPFFTDGDGKGEEGSRTDAPRAPRPAGMDEVSNADESSDHHEDVDHYFELQDEVVPLTVQQRGATMSMQENTIANSPVLTTKHFNALQEYFLREFRFLLNLEDVRTQNVSVNINLGAAYCCLARQGSYSSPLKHATFSEFVERMNAESMQLYFIRDCPICVSRAVDMECGSLNHEASLTVVKIFFFSNERQSRSMARAAWDSQENRFRLLDMENIGVAFNWTVFSLDESFVPKKKAENVGSVQAPMSIDAAEPTPATRTATEAEDELARNKTVAYPFEVEFRAFRRWKQQTEHPAAELAEAILEELSMAEHNFLNHGSSAVYEQIDLGNVCNIDYEAEDINVESIIVEHTARAKPAGTDLLVDNSTSLFIENFAAARQLKEKVVQYGPIKAAELQNASNNNYVRGQMRDRRGRGNRTGLSLGPQHLENVLRPTSKLTFFRSRGSTIHWRLKPSLDIEENIAPMTEALSFLQQVLHTANDIERNSVRAGQAPAPL